MSRKSGSLASLQFARKKKKEIMTILKTPGLARRLDLQEQEFKSISDEVEKNSLKYIDIPVGTKHSLKVLDHTIHFIKDSKENFILVFDHKDQKMIGSGQQKKVYSSYRIDCNPPQKYATMRLILNNSEEIQAAHKEVHLTNLIDSPYVSKLTPGGKPVEKDGITSWTLCSARANGDLFDLTKRLHEVSFSDVFVICYGIVAGLSSAHQTGVIHQDMKPENILINESKFGLYPQISDFGNAVEEKNKEQSVVTGNPQYLAPESLTPRLESVMQQSEKILEYVEQSQRARGLRDTWKQEGQLVLSDKPNKKNDVWSLAAIFVDFLYQYIEINKDALDLKQHEILNHLIQFSIEILTSPKQHRKNMTHILQTLQETKKDIIQEKVAGYLNIQSQIILLESTALPASQPTRETRPSPSSHLNLSTSPTGFLTGGNHTAHQQSGEVLSLTGAKTEATFK